MSSSEALKCLNWLPLAGRRLSHRCTAVENAIKGDIPQHFESFKSTFRSLHGIIVKFTLLLILLLYYILERSS